ncbi:hypothetical protein K491DRAFT_722773 [Lophiostoma macrostomum CBS 122681]|uniref:SRR1-like domain-containing protein n=1 Tax=Lophiostoma macrostomum CBS 122681 TaxID=1314788 RepID=A0A6A6SL93_9PLEO|nr:hypothetical protein K491DRAFT_722773 [Lophiostoma macrostomum CBS 122681]
MDSESVIPKYALEISNDETNNHLSALASYYVIGNFENRPIFTRKLIEFASQQLGEGGKLEDPYDLVDLDGDTHRRDGPRFYTGADGGIYGQSPMGWILMYFPYIHVPESCRHLVPPSEKRTIAVEYTRSGDQKPCKCDQVSSEMLKEWEADWKRSAYRRNLIAQLKKHVRDTEPVKQIICFGTGRLEAKHSYLQHLAACTVRRIVLEKQDALGGRTSLDHINIYAQDPGYCRNCKMKLSKLDIDVVDDPKGVLLMDKSRFVVSFAPDIPVWQLAVDMLFDEGGPAGMLCDVIEDLSDSDVIVCAANPWSPNVHAYVDRCVALVVVDTDGLEERVHVSGWSGLYLKSLQNLVK